MNILALDYGRKRIGVAWVDTGINVVLPLGVIENTGEAVFTKLADLIKKENADTVVIGLPTGMDGSENENTKNIRAFGEKLEKSISTPIVFVDERFSSRQADAMGQGVSRDEKSAMVILDSYLESVRRKAKN